MAGVEFRQYIKDNCTVQVVGYGGGGVQTVHPKDEEANHRLPWSRSNTLRRVKNVSFRMNKNTLLALNKERLYLRNYKIC